MLLGGGAGALVRGGGADGWLQRPGMGWPQSGQAPARSALLCTSCHERRISTLACSLLSMSAARSSYVYYEPLGWDDDRVTELFMNQLHRKLGMVGVSLPPDMEDMLSMAKPTLAGG